MHPSFGASLLSLSLPPSLSFSLCLSAPLFERPSGMLRNLRLVQGAGCCVARDADVQHRKKAIFTRVRTAQVRIAIKAGAAVRSAGPGPVRYLPMTLATTGVTDTWQLHHIKLTARQPQVWTHERRAHDKVLEARRRCDLAGKTRRVQVQIPVS